MTTRIRPANVADIGTMLQLERAAVNTAHWGEDEYKRIFDPGAVKRIALVADDGAFNGFVVARTAGPEWEIENVVVSESRRQRRIGTALIAQLLQCAREAGAEGVMLEVRASNSPARRLYQTTGFSVCGHRTGYYHDPEEDAIVYRNHLSAGTPESH